MAGTYSAGVPLQKRGDGSSHAAPLPAAPRRRLTGRRIGR
jgi:hypothetical protein